MSKAVKRYAKAAEQEYGDATFLYKVGTLYEKGNGKNDMSEAVKWYRKAADKGYGDAAFFHKLGKIYEDGTGVEKDLKEAAGWYVKAVGLGYQGDAAFLHQLGTFYENGTGGQQDIMKAVEWYRKAVDKGYDDSQLFYKLAVFYGADDSDMTEAVKWYAKAAEQGVSKAQYCLGRCYEEGTGIEKDIGKAVEWYLKAAELGYGDAEFYYRLGSHFESRTDYVPPQTTSGSVRFSSLPNDRAGLFLRGSCAGKACKSGIRNTDVHIKPACIAICQTTGRRLLLCAPAQDHLGARRTARKCIRSGTSSCKAGA